MLKLNWKLVEEKAEALYPRYRDGMKYSELQVELRHEGLNQDHINAIAEALERRYREDHSKGISIPLAIFSVSVAVVFILGISLIFETGNILIAVAACLMIFVIARIILRHKRQINSSKERWKNGK